MTRRIILVSRLCPSPGVSKATRCFGDSTSFLLQVCSMLEFDAYYMYRRGQLAGHFTLKILDSKYHRNVKNIIKLYKAQLPKQDELK